MSRSCCIKWFVVGCCLGLWSSAQAQSYVYDYFVSPIRPGEQGSIAGNMGELRSNHFHGGLDIRTDKKIGLPVLAAADGYIERIKVSTSGYGNVLYMRHPNGYSTVYAHLDRFFGTLHEYVKKQRYLAKTSEIELFPVPGSFYYVQKDTLAFSGNSGGSSGPHLHFEIRDYDEKVLNPLKFGLSEFPDSLPPVISKLALHPIDIYSRADHEFGTIQFKFAKEPSTGNYYLHDTIAAWGNLRASVLAYDLSNTPGFRNGVYRVILKFNGKPLYFNNLESFAFEESRYINVHKDYGHTLSFGEKLQRCFVADGNKLGIYVDTDCQSDLIQITDTGYHYLHIEVWDAFDHYTQATVVLKGTPPEKQIDPVLGKTITYQFKQEIFENILKLSLMKSTIMPDMMLYAGSSTLALPAAYLKRSSVVYLWDLRQGLPDSALVEGKVIPFHFVTTIPHATQKTFITDHFSLKIPPDALYDTLYLQAHVPAEHGKEYFGKLVLGDPLIPLHTPIQVSLKVDKPILDISKTAVYAYYGSSISYVGGSWHRDEITFETKSMGTFVLAADSVPPVVLIKEKTSKQLVCKISDNRSGIGTFKVLLNGEWLLMNYDHKTRLIWSELLDETQNLKGQLRIEVTDRSGNTKVVETVI